MPWIRTIPPEEATGRLAEGYGWQAHKLGRPTEFTQLGSLDAEVMYARLVLYRASENVPSRLPLAPAHADQLPDVDSEYDAALRVAGPAAVAKG